jgi:hypothetical protein
MHHFKLLTWPVSLFAIVTPWWLPVLKSISDFSAILLPIAGLSWIALQAGLALHSHFFRKRH